MLRSIVIAVLAASALTLPRLATAQDNPFSNCKSSDVRRLGVRSEAIAERPAARRTTLIGAPTSPVIITCDDTTLTADQVVWDDDTGDLRASGNVVFQQSDLRVSADRADMNSKSKLGTFYEASGAARLGSANAPKSQFGSLEPDVLFHGAKLERTGPKTYRLSDGAFTTCVQPTPRWELTGSQGVITLDKRVVMRNVVLKVKDVPLLYLPVMYYPIDKSQRSTGFLLPTYGSSLQRGTSLSNAFFWAISRNQDATVFHDWFTKTGQALGSEYRYVQTQGSRGRVNFYLINEHDPVTSSTTAPQTSHRSYSLDGDLNQALPAGFRAFARANYFTDITSQQNFQNVFDYSRRDRSFSASVSGAVGRYRLTAIVDQRDLFYGTNQGQRSGRAPSVSAQVADKAIGGSRVYFGAAGDMTYIVRQDDVNKPETNRSLMRFDGAPTVRAALSTLPFLSATGTGSVRLTRWLESIDPITGLQVPVALNRQLIDMQLQVVGPVFSRIFQTPGNGYADRFKHLIEPSFSINRKTPFTNFGRVAINDYSVDGLVGGVTTINYRLTNRLLARRPLGPAVPGGPPPPATVQPLLSVDVSQTHYSDSTAALYDIDYQSNTAVGQSGNATTAPKAVGSFSPLRITAALQPTDRTSARFSMDVDPKYKAIRTLNASGTLTSARVDLDATWTKTQFIPQLPGFNDPARLSHYLQANTVVHTADGRVGGNYLINLDITQREITQQRIVASYNSQCCGIQFDWQSIKTPYLTLPYDRRFGISFTLAGIGSFSNPLGSFGGQR